jgi:hypothetical protein
LAEAAYGMGDFETARSHLSQAMALGVQCGLRPRLALALYHWAVLLLKESEQAASGASGGTGPLRQAAEILTLIAREPANWLVFRERSQRLLAQLQPQLPPQVVAQIDADLANRSLEDVAGELLVWPVVNTSVTG